MTEKTHALLKEAIAQLIDESELDSVLACCAPLDFSETAAKPHISLLHVKFSEDKPSVSALASYLWRKCLNYALTRRRRLKFQEAMINKADVSIAAEIVRAAKSVLIEFNKNYPSRASEVGEVLAYCVAIHYLNAAQVAAKMSLKTSANMPVHGLDGIHMAFVNDALTVYFLESKLAKSANDGASDYAESVAAFSTNDKQYLREYSIVGDLGNLDTLDGEAREVALEYFDIIGSPNSARRERSVGIVCYSESKHFSDTIPVSLGPVDAHQKHFSNNYLAELNHHRDAVSKHLKFHGADASKCIVFFVAVPDVNALRESFYEAMGSLEAGQ